MTSFWYIVSMAIAFVAGWFLCSYYEQEARNDERRVGEPDEPGLAGYDPHAGHYWE